MSSSIKGRRVVLAVRDTRERKITESTRIHVATQKEYGDLDNGSPKVVKTSKRPVVVLVPRFKEIKPVLRLVKARPRSHLRRSERIMDRLDVYVSPARPVRRPRKHSSTSEEDANGDEDDDIASYVEDTGDENLAGLDGEEREIINSSESDSEVEKKVNGSDGEESDERENSTGVELSDETSDSEENDDDDEDEEEEEDETNDDSSAEIAKRRKLANRVINESKRSTSATKSKRMKSNHREEDNEYRVAFSSFPVASKEKMEALAKELGMTVVNEIRAPFFTHVVVPSPSAVNTAMVSRRTSGNFGTALSRQQEQHGGGRCTMKVLAALAKGAPIVSEKWIFQSAKRRAILDIDDFVLKKEFPGCVPKKTRRGILSGLRVLVRGETSPSPADMELLVQLADGNLATSTKECDLFIGPERYFHDARKMHKKFLADSAFLDALQKGKLPSKLTS